jgi:hypothetical protein
MMRGTTERRHVTRVGQRAVACCLVAFCLSCAGHRIPEPLRGYEVLVEGRDEQSVELARALRSSGFRVRDRVRGGGRPILAVIYFTFSDPGPGQPTWFHVRLADTRSGVIVGAGTVLLDSSVVTPRARAKAAVQALSHP